MQAAWQPAESSGGGAPIQFLLVEDTSFVRESIVETLTREGHRVLEAETGEEALAHFADAPIDFVLLDIILPDTDGFQLCKRIRDASDVPIVMLTALYHTEDILRGFEVGADDYITKPFSANELLGRIASILRRLGGGDIGYPRPVVSEGDIALDVAKGIAKLGDRTIELSPIEARLLHYLMERPNRPVHKEELFQEVWGYELAGGTNLVEVAVRRLRTKIEQNPSQPQLVHTVHGFGYRFNHPTEETS